MPLGTHYGDTSIAEDVTNIIYQITPEDTPFYNMIADRSSNSPKHEWQVRSLSTRADNATVEGASYTFAAPVLPTRAENLTQIVKKDVRISGTSQATARHAISDLVSDQMEQRMIEWKTDAEHALLRGSDASGNASDTARRMNGLLNAVTSNVSSVSGETITETIFNDLLQDVWDSGGKPRDVLCHGYLKRRISSFVGNATKNFNQGEKKVQNVISMYESDFSTVAVQTSRDMPNSAGEHTIAVLDRDLFAKAWLRPVITKRVAETADSIDIVILGELTLEFGNEAAAGLRTGS